MGFNSSHCVPTISWLTCCQQLPLFDRDIGDRVDLSDQVLITENSVGRWDTGLVSNRPKTSVDKWCVWDRSAEDTTITYRLSPSDGECPADEASVTDQIYWIRPEAEIWRLWRVLAFEILERLSFALVDWTVEIRGHGVLCTDATKVSQE